MDASTTVEQLYEIANVVNDLEKIRSEIESCDGFCGNVTNIRYGFDLFNRTFSHGLRDAPVLMNETSYKDMLNITELVAEGLFTPTVSVIGARGVLGRFSTFEIKKARSEISTLYKLLDEIIKSKVYFEKLKETIPELNTSHVKIKTEKVVVLEKLLIDLANNKSEIEKFNEDIPKVFNKSSAVGDLLSTENIKGIEKKLILFSTRQLRASQKTTTAAFENLDDLNKIISNDLKSEIVKNLLAEGKSLESLVTRLSPLSQLSTTLKPISDSFKNVPQNISASLITKELSSFSKKLDQFQILGSIQKCVSGVNFTYTLSFDKWKFMKDEAQDFDKDRENFLKASKKDIYAGFKEIFNLQTLLLEYLNNKTDLTTVKTFEKIDELIKECEQFKIDLGEVYKDVRPWYELEFALQNTGWWNDKSRVLPAISCLSKYNSLEKGMKVANDPIPEISNMSFVGEAAAVFNSSVAMLKMFDESRKNEKLNPERKTIGELNLTTSNQFSTGLDVLRRLAKAHEKKDDIRKLMASVKRQEVWSYEQKIVVEEFRTLPGRLETFSKSVPQPKTLDDVWKVLAKAQRFSFPRVESWMIRNAFKMFYTPHNLQETLDAVASLDWDFKNARWELKDSMAATDTIQEYFENRFGEKKTLDEMKTETKINASNFRSMIFKEIGWMIIGFLFFS